MASHEDYSRSHEVKRASNRSFGFVFTAVFATVGLWPLIGGHPVRGWALAVAGVMLAVSLAAPALLAAPNRLWMGFGMLLHRIVSPIALGFMFYLVVTPMGALMRLFGKDNLRLRRNDPSDSYWIRRDPPGPRPDSLDNQF